MAISKNKQRIKACTSSNAPVAMVAGRKITFNSAILTYLEIKPEDIGRDSTGENGVGLEVDSETSELLIYRAPRSEASIVGGSFSSPETYCADICKAILKVIGKELVNAGTVNFPAITKDVFEEDDSKVIVVDLKKVSANPGVFVEK